MTRHAHGLQRLHRHTQHVVVARVLGFEHSHVANANTNARVEAVIQPAVQPAVVSREPVEAVGDGKAVHGEVGELQIVVQIAVAVAVAPVAAAARQARRVRVGQHGVRVPRPHRHRVAPVVDLEGEAVGGGDAVGGSDGVGVFFPRPRVRCVAQGLAKGETRQVVVQLAKVFALQYE